MSGKSLFSDYLPSVPSGSSGAYVPPGQRSRGLSSWNLPRHRTIVNDTPKKVLRENLTEDDFPTLGGDSPAPAANKPSWGAHLAKKKDSPKKKTLVNWNDLNKPLTKHERAAPVFRQKASRSDDLDAEWREEYAQMYPQDTGDFNAPSQKPYDDDWEDSQSDAYFTTTKKFSGRRARKNCYDEEGM